jgi:hypothetical protein
MLELTAEQALNPIGLKAIYNQIMHQKALTTMHCNCKSGCKHVSLNIRAVLNSNFNPPEYWRGHRDYCKLSKIESDCDAIALHWSPAHTSHSVICGAQSHHVSLC